MWHKRKLPDELGKIEMDRLQAYVGHSRSDMNLVGQYETAVNILTNYLIDSKERVDVIAHPLLYLMRHSIELALKENIRYLSKYSNLSIEKIKTHSLSALFDEFEKHYYKIADELDFKDEIEEEYKKYTKKIKELIENLGDDFGSFRYVNSMDGKKIFDLSEILNIFELKKLFDDSHFFLTHTVDAISPYTDFVDYARVDSSIVPISFGRVLLCIPEFQKDLIIEKLNELYVIIKGGEVWFDKVSNHNLCLRFANNKYYIIPIVK